MSSQKNGPEELSKLKKEYENKLENTNYKRHFNSLIFIINYINQDEGNIDVIETIKDFVDTSNDSKKQRDALRAELQIQNPKQIPNITNLSTNDIKSESNEKKPEIEKIISELSDILNQNEKKLGLKDFTEKDKILSNFSKKIYETLGDNKTILPVQVKNNFLLQIKNGFEKIKNISKNDIDSVRNQIKKVDSTFLGSDSELLTIVINSNFFQDIINHGEAIKMSYLDTIKIKGSKTGIEESYSNSILKSFYYKLGEIDKKSGFNIKDQLINEIKERGRIQNLDINSIVISKLNELVSSKKIDRDESKQIREEYSTVYQDFLSQNYDVNKFKTLTEGNKNFEFDSENFEQINLLTFQERISGFNQDELKLLLYMLEEAIPYIGDAKTIERRISEISGGFGLTGKKMGGVDKGFAIGEIALSILAVASGFTIIKSGIKSGSILNKIQKMKGLVSKTIDLKTSEKAEKGIINSSIKTSDVVPKTSKKAIIESGDAAKKIDLVDNVNIDGALKLGDVTVEKLSKFDSVPRIIEISDGKFISVVSTSSTSDGKQIFTVRYGITNQSAKLPPFEGISTFVIDEKKISFSEPKTRLEKNDYSSMQKALINKILGKREIKEETPLEKLVSSNNLVNTTEAKSISNLEIFKAGKNSKGQDVLIVNVNDINGKGLSQFEVNTYKEGQDLVFYLGSMAKSSKTFNINDLFELIPKIGSLAGDKKDITGYKIKYFRIDSTGESGKEKVIRVPLSNLNKK